MIDEKSTFEKFGYYSIALKPKSNKKIISACDDCGKIRESGKNEYCALCHSCSHKGSKSSLWKGGPITRVCGICGKSFLADLSQIKKGWGKYCSRKCMGMAQSKYRKGKNNTNWKGGAVKRICKECGEGFFIPPSWIKKGGGTFCSLKCRDLAFSKNNKGPNSPLWKGGKVKRVCKNCKIPFYVYPSRIRGGWGAFCSNECRILFNRGKNSPAWKGGISFEPYCSKFNEEFKKYIRAKFDNVCFLCGKTEEENGRKLDVHHVNYDKNCGCAETKEDKKAEDESCQFVPLCRSCNSKVNKNRALWELRIKNKMKNKLYGWYI